MSAQPNALAVLDDLIADMGDTPGTTGHQVAQVRAAVAELIEAVAGIYGADGNGGNGRCPPDCMSCRIQRALARAQGVQS